MKNRRNTQFSHIKIAKYAYFNTKITKKCIYLHHRKNLKKPQIYISDTILPTTSDTLKKKLKYVVKIQNG